MHSSALSISSLAISCGSFTDRGAKAANQDHLGFRAPQGAFLTTKGMAAAIADGVSSSERGGDAAIACVSGFLSDYFSTPESWSVKKSAQQILNALNSWLYRQGLGAGDRQNPISTLSAVICKSTTAHIFHVGDSRIYRLRGESLEQLTVDHRIWTSANKNYLSRAMGSDIQLQIDYARHNLEAGDYLIMTTDGVHDFVQAGDYQELLSASGQNLDKAAELLVRRAAANNSPDNLSCQILRIDSLPSQQADEVFQQLTELPFPPELQEDMILDGFRILRELYASKRSQLYLAIDTDSNEEVVIKTPSANYVDDVSYIERFTLEEWVGRRLDNPHVLKVFEPSRRRRFLYHIAEYLPGQTLRQWMHDNPGPTLEEVRLIIEQIAAGLQAFHRQEMLHQDLKPENIMVSETGTWKIVDFGSTKVAGIAEIDSPVYRPDMLGTKNYTAPEYITGATVGNAADIFSLGVIAYEMLTGQVPYGPLPSSWNAKTWQATCYIPAKDCNGAIPQWFDGMLRKAVHPDPSNRYHELSEFLYDLRNPNQALAFKDNRPLLERDPLTFWRGTSAVLAVLLVWLLVLHFA